MKTTSIHFSDNDLSGTEQRTRRESSLFLRLQELGQKVGGAMFWRFGKHRHEIQPDDVLRDDISEEEALKILAQAERHNFYALAPLMVGIERGEIPHGEIKREVAKRLRNRKRADATVRYYLGRTRSGTGVLRRGGWSDV